MSIHQGGKLEALRKLDKRPNDELAALWQVSIATMYNYYDSPEIPSKKLRRICEIMGWDYKSNFISGENLSENETLKRENELLRDQVKQLKEMIELMKENKTFKSKTGNLVS